MTIKNEFDKLLGDFQALRYVVNPAQGIQDFSEFLQIKRRHVYLFGSIEEEDNEEENTAYLIKVLHLLDEISIEPITMFINSPGGSILAGLAVIQTMQDLSAPVNTFVIGQAASMAGVVAVAGARRLAYPCARWLLHRGKSAASGDADDIAIEAKELKTVDTYADQIVVNHTKIPPEKLNQMQRKNFWVGVREALEYGLIDEVVIPKNGPASWEAWLPDPKLKTRRRDEDGGDEGEARQ